MQVFLLHELAAALGVDATTVLRWRTARLIATESEPRRGRGVATRLTRDQAREIAALSLLRRAGVPMQQLGSLVHEFRRGGKRGPDFFTLGAAGGAALVDGLGPGVPLRDPRTGQTTLFAELDLRSVRPAVENLLDRLARTAADA